jgi:hypothetical protein
VPADNTSILTVLDEGALEQVLVAAKAAKVLGLLASSSRQLCRFARSRVPINLVVLGQEHAGLIIRSHALGRPPFSGCTFLHISAGDSLMCCLTQGVLQAAQQWTGLQQLTLGITLCGQDGHMQDSCTSTLLGGVCALQRLRRLRLYTSSLGVCCAAQLQQLTQLTCLDLCGTQAPVDAAADLTPLSRLTNLVELHLNWALAPHLPGGPEGPYCLPSSLVTLELCSEEHTSPAPMACWVAHLPGCPQLQHLKLAYGPQQHASAHPSALVPRLAQHQPHLRTLSVAGGCGTVNWGEAVAGLPAAARPVGRGVRPTAALAALTGLQRLTTEGMMCIRKQADWQHLARLPSLTSLRGVCISSVPDLQAGSTLVLLELEEGEVALGGYDVGRLLLACTLLERASINVKPPARPAAAGAALAPHPKLQAVTLGVCSKWGEPAQVAAHFAALAPVLSSVPELRITGWPHGSSREALIMPDLSPCTALTQLGVAGDAWCGDPEPPLEQESILSMVAPLKQLQRLEVTNAPRVNARIALVLQSMLPQLQCVVLEECGRLLPVTAAAANSDDSSWSDEDEEDEQEVLVRQQVLQLLRAGLEVQVDGYAD